MRVSHFFSSSIDPPLVRPPPSPSPPGMPPGPAGPAPAPRSAPLVVPALNPQCVCWGCWHLGRALELPAV